MFLVCVNAVLVHIDFAMLVAIHTGTAVGIAEGKLFTTAGVVVNRVDALLLGVQATIGNIVIIEGCGIGVLPRSRTVD